MKYNLFPLADLPQRKFNLGDRVQHEYSETINSDKYLDWGTIFGYHYQHPAWANDPHASWIYCVVWTEGFTQSPGQNPTRNPSSCPFTDHFPENQLRLIESAHTPQMPLPDHNIRLLFGIHIELQRILEQCNLTIIGQPEGALLLIDCPAKWMAEALHQLYPQLQNILKALHLSDRVLVKTKGISQEFWHTGHDPQTLATTNIKEIPTVTENNLRSPTELAAFFRTATYEKVLDFLAKEQSPICITSMLTDQCLMMNNKFSPERIIWTPSQYIGLNFKYFWDSLDEYQRLIAILKSDGFVSDFTYKWRRVDWSSIDECKKDFYLIENFLGEPARISISKS